MFVTPLWFWTAVRIDTASLTVFDCGSYFHKRSSFRNSLQQSGLSKRIESSSFACLDLTFHFHHASPSKSCISFQSFVDLQPKQYFLLQVVQHTTAMDHLY